MGIKNNCKETKNTIFAPQNCGVEQLVARWAHNPKVAGSSPAPATKATLCGFFIAVMYYVYVIQCSVSGKRYTGFTSDLTRRLKEHNSGKSKFTAGFGPWTIIYHENINTRDDARKKEKYLKSFINKVAGSPPDR
jgi:putative endonuclease